MASHSEPRIYLFKNTAAIAKGKAVKISGAAGDTVVVGAANTDKCIGIIQNDATSALEGAEVALQGGGAKALIAETVSAGNQLCAATDGRLEKVNASGDWYICTALQDGVAGDLIAVEVQCGFALAAQ